MLPRIVLFALQLATAWYVADVVVSFVARGFSVARSNEIYVYAVIYPLLIMLVGYAGSRVLKQVTTPSGATLILTLALSIALSLITLFPQAMRMVEILVPSLRVATNIYPLVGALIGYYIKR